MKIIVILLLYLSMSFSATDAYFGKRYICNGSTKLYLFKTKQKIWTIQSNILIEWKLIHSNNIYSRYESKSFADYLDISHNNSKVVWIDKDGSNRDSELNCRVDSSL